jgi:hypothetical protein
VQFSNRSKFLTPLKLLSVISILAISGCANPDNDLNEARAEHSKATRQIQAGKDEAGARYNRYCKGTNQSDLKCRTAVADFQKWENAQKKWDSWLNGKRREHGQSVQRQADNRRALGQAITVAGALAQGYSNAQANSGHLH